MRKRGPWGLVALLATVMVISFIDRGNLSVAAPAMVADLKISSWGMGVLLSAFFWTYAFFQIISGWLVDRFEVRWVYLIGFLLWTAATFSTGLVSSFATLLVFRMLLGIGESVTYPATSRILAAVVPENRRGLANSIVDLGARVGPAAGIFLEPWFAVVGALADPFAQESRGTLRAGCRGAELGPASAVAIGVGHLRRPLRGELFLVLPADLAANVPGERAPRFVRLIGVSGDLAVPVDGYILIGLRDSRGQAHFRGAPGSQSEKGISGEWPDAYRGVHAGGAFALGRDGDYLSDDCLLHVRDLRIEPVRVDTGAGGCRSGGALDRFAERVR
jgi:MFS family permease